MTKPVSVKRLLSDDERKVAEMVIQLEAPQAITARELWTQRFSASTKGGKCTPA